MTKRDKRIDAMRRNPRHVRPEELDVALVGLGYVARQRGSHRHYTLGSLDLTIPQRRPFLLQTYVLQALEQIDALMNEAEGSGENDGGKGDDNGDGN